MYILVLFGGFEWKLSISLNDETWESGYWTVMIIPLARIVFNPHSVSSVERQHCQVRSCFVIFTTAAINSHCPGLCWTVQHYVYIDSLCSVTLNIDKEDVYPRPGSSKYPVTRVVAVAYVCDDHGEYQGTAAPGTATWWNRGCKSYFWCCIYKYILSRNCIICVNTILISIIFNPILTWNSLNNT